MDRKIISKTKKRLSSNSGSRVKKTRFKSWRIELIIGCLFVVAAIILANLFSIQVLKGEKNKKEAENQQQILRKLIPQRGDIFVQDKLKGSLLASSSGGEKNKNYVAIATSREYIKLEIIPKDIPVDKDEEVAARLSEILSLPKDEIFKKVSDKEGSNKVLANKLSDEQVEKIKNLKIKGILLIAEDGRFYPAGNFLSQTLGFVGFSENSRIGQYGVEGFYNKELEGESGLLDAARDAFGRAIFATDYNKEPAKNGETLILTIDQNIQFMAEKELNDVVSKWQADSGTVIVMDPKTGKLLAIANTPAFDPNNYSKVENIEFYLNGATQKTYEPGSVFKPITMAAAINEKKVQPETTYTDTGVLQIGGYKIENAAERSYGVCTMTKVLEKSINTGAVFAQRSIGPDVFTEYVKKFGFNEKTGVDLAGEVFGNINNLKKNGPDINFATASFGQGITVTPLEMVSAIGAIANQGKLMKPYIVEKIIDSNGNEKTIEPAVRAEVVTPETAFKVTSMLVSTVRNGYDKIKMNDYVVAGKTGTAQIADPKTGQYGDEGFIHTFIGYAPAFDPKFIILFKMDRPKGINFASDSLSPAFANLAKYLLDYFEIPPEQ